MLEDNVRKFLRRIPSSRRRSLRHVRPLPCGRAEVDGRVVVDFSSNDYLGQRFEHPELDGNHHGAACSSRLLSGNHPLFESIEQKLATWKGTDSALVMGSGFQLNTTVLGTLLSHRLHGRIPGAGIARPAINVFVDKLAHASMHTGLQLAGVKQHRFRHNDLVHLRELIERAEAAGRDNSVGPVPNFIVTESVFSMDGDHADIAGLRQVADEYRATLMVDEAHAVGVVGETGAGWMSLEKDRQNSDNLSREEIIIGTFSKAFTAFGGYVACPSWVRDLLVNACPGLIYSTGLPPVVLRRIEWMIDRIPRLMEQRRRLQHISERLQTHLRRQGRLLVQNLDAAEGDEFASGADGGTWGTPIVPVFIGDDERTMEIARRLLENGFLVGAVRPPTVPEGTSRLRISLSAAHSESDVDQLARCLEKELAS